MQFWSGLFACAISCSALRLLDMAWPPEKLMSPWVYVAVMLLALIGQCWVASK